MALIYCPECKKDMPAPTGACPHCGFTFTSSEISSLVEPTMKELRDFLQEKAGIDEFITIVYGGGSRPGEARQLVVASCSDAYFRVKQYKIENVLWAEDSSGKRITAKDDVQAFESAFPRFETLREYADLLTFFAEYPAACRGDECMPCPGGYKGGVEHPPYPHRPLCDNMI